MIFTREYKENWNLFNKISFRFVFIYFAQYCLFGFIGAIWKAPTYWIAENVFSITYEFSSKGYGSGDTTFQYVQAFLFVCLAIFGTIIWSLLDRKRKSYNKFNYGFLVFIRVVFVYYLFVYGMAKVFYLQMTPPTYSQLIQPLGEMSPMRLAWVFMGFSKGYSVFAGGVEILAALLLIPRRTQTFGALVSIAVMTQVFIMNMCFDIPVKLFSFHLLLIGIILFLSDFKRYFKLLFKNEAIEKNEIYPKRNKEGSTLIPIVKSILLVILLWLMIPTNLSRSKNVKERSNPYLAGVWNVTSFQKTDSISKETFPDNQRWKNLVVSFKGSMNVLMMDDSYTGYKTEIDTINKNITFENSNYDFTLKYHATENYLQLNGSLGRDTVEIKFLRKTKADFYLTNRGFHWINESPNNR
jgi:hypothetical protein